MTEIKQTKAKEQANGNISSLMQDKMGRLDSGASHLKGEKLGSTKNNKKYVYVKLNAKNPAIDVATKLGMI